MDETKKIGLFKAFGIFGEAFVGGTETSQSPIKWEDLKGEDFRAAGVTVQEKEDLRKSLDIIKEIVYKFYSNIKSKVNKRMSKYRETKSEKSQTTIINTKNVQNQEHANEIEQKIPEEK